MRLFARLVTTFIVLGGIQWCQVQQHVHQLTEEEIGSVRFLTTCSKSTEANFSRAVALLHSFQYELARDAFTDISKEDQNCAMAYWGIGMSYYNGFANSIDIDDGRRALQKAQHLAVENRDTSAREEDYINALAEIYRDGTDSSARAQAICRGLERACARSNSRKLLKSENQFHTSVGLLEKREVVGSSLPSRSRTPERARVIMQPVIPT